MTGGAADELRTLLALPFDAWDDSDCEEWVLAHGRDVLALIEAAQAVDEQFSRGLHVSVHDLDALAAAVARLTEPQT